MPESKEERVARRWQLLKKALLKKTITPKVFEFGVLSPPKVYSFDDCQSLRSQLQEDQQHHWASAVALSTLDPSIALPKCHTIQGDDDLIADYKVHEYTVGDRKSILVRERIHLNVSLQELATHHATKIDNTGNIRVWDCEKTLTWVLMQMKLSPDKVIEVGAGMAGLAALSCTEAKEVIITDGQEQCVRNNEVNVVLNQATDRIDCRLLKWSYHVEEQLADLVVIADCTHFQEFHGELLWTLIQCARAGGKILMVQPERADSWRNFLTLATVVSSLVKIEPWTHPVLEARHLDLQQTPDYDEHLHRPRVYIFTKLRSANQGDQQLVRQHIQNRNS